jgi:hypothetical protein
MSCAGAGRPLESVVRRPSYLLLLIRQKRANPAHQEPDLVSGQIDGHCMTRFATATLLRGYEVNAGRALAP